MNIAVIVPVYNVEKYLSNCIESLLKQTIKNYVIYLIDDGSTDKSGEICDKYKKKYEEKIKVFHKKNGGLSDARNYGVKKSTEELITFVDSDDTICENYLEKLYFALYESNADISVAEYIPVKNQILNKNYKTKNTYCLENNIEFLKSALLGKKGSLSSCAKLYKRYLLEKNPFPVSQLYEDMEIVYNILCNVSSVSYVNEKLYFYLKRSNSIVNSKVTEKHKYGLYSCINMLEKDANCNNKKLQKYIKCRIVKQACGHLPNLVKYNDLEMFSDISKIVKPYLNSVVFGKIAPLKTRILAISYYMKPKSGIRYSKYIFKIKNKISYMKRKKQIL